MINRINMSKVAEEHIALIKEKREKGLSFAATAEILRKQGIIVNSVAVNKAYNNYIRNLKMTKIIANDTFGHQMIFETFIKAGEHFHCAPSVIKKKIDKGDPIRDTRSSWWLDTLVEEE